MFPSCNSAEMFMPVFPGLIIAMSVLSHILSKRLSAFLRGVGLFTLASLVMFGCGAAPGQQSPTVQATGHSVILFWTPSISKVNGYTIYRSMVGPGGPYLPLATTLPSATRYTDTNVVAGQPYFYQLTAFDSANRQSLPTAAVYATIPSPWRIAWLKAVSAYQKLRKLHS